MNWPTLISLWSAATGLAIAAFPAERLLHHRGFWQSEPERTIVLVLAASVLALIVLSIFLYLGRLWARRALVGALICFILTICAFIAFNDWRVALYDFTRVPVYIIVLTPPLFVLGVLFQPDVIRAFPPKHRSAASKDSST